ncbi:M28 family metallopeptidase [Paracoccus sp. (in: a-proteobacteria)]|uniref:M28 family metallopeptidase n=1 Tax=Paracoccus sp. TaxID=267 RepID=UPI00321FC917
MDYLIFDLPAEAAAARRELAGLAEAGSWVRFGRRAFVFGSGAGWRGLDAVSRAPAGGEVRKGNLHLVVQKGRRFQQENPEVRVLLDQGRFLVVDLPPGRARALAGRREPCFHIEPLGANRTVFRDLPREAPGSRAAPEVAAVVAAVSQADFLATLTRLTAIRSRLSTGPGYAEAAEWMRAQLTALGLATRLEPIEVNGAPSHNVIAHRPGTAAARRHLLVTAHLDSVNHAEGPAAPAPGADDNASGASGVLVLARALAGATLAQDVSFVLFGGEEQGLFGSQQFVAALPQPERQRIDAVLNMDMIGAVNTQPPTVMLEGAALSQAMIDDLAAAAAAFTGLAVQTSLNPFASDHVPFIEAGIPAVLTIEGGDSANDAIHSGNDTPDRLDPGFATQILRMNAGFLALAAGAGAGAAADGTAVPRPCGCCGAPAEAAADGTADGAAALRQLAGHYHALFAQYARLQRDGRIGPADLARQQQAWRAYDALPGRPGRQ